MRWLLQFLGLRPREEDIEWLHEESLRDAEILVDQFDSKEIAQAAHEQLPEIIRGLNHDGVQPDRVLIWQFADTAAKQYITDHHHYGDLNIGLVHRIFRAEYEHALGGNGWYE